jgi:hypothetical protein
MVFVGFGSLFGPVPGIGNLGIGIEVGFGFGRRSGAIQKFMLLLAIHRNLFITGFGFPRLRARIHSSESSLGVCEIYSSRVV